MATVEVGHHIILHQSYLNHQTLYSDPDSSSMLEALSEKMSEESSSEAEPVKRAAASSTEYLLDF